MTKAQALRNRLWGALLVAGYNGVRKGSTIWSVLEWDGTPLAARRHLPVLRDEARVALRELGLSIRPMRTGDLVTPSAASAALREIADVVDADRDMAAVLGDRR